MKRFEALVSLNMVLDVGSIRLNRMLEAFGSAENILKAPEDKLLQIQGIGVGIAAKIAALKKEDLDKELAEAKKLGLRILTIDDCDYPENLKQIYDPPIVLYVKGSMIQADKFSIAIVGSRRASFYGLSSAEKFGFDLAQKGFTVVSGMARGIDTAAHRGALKQGGRTLAVIGSGFNHLYPEENRKLADEISKNGAVISEFPLNTLPFPQNFPRRNRVVSGLSLGVLVVEAARNSGALITSDFALEQGRDVFALPGKVDSVASFGPNALIQQGAKLVFSAEDIAQEYIIPEPVAGETKMPQEKVFIEETGDEVSWVCSMLSKEPVSLDELVEKTNMDIPRISDILLKLRLKKLVKELPGKQFARCN